MKILHAQKTFSAKKTLTKLHFILNPEVSTWPFIWFYTLVFTVLISSQFSWFRRVPFEISNPTWLNGGVPITANIAKHVIVAEPVVAPMQKDSGLLLFSLSFHR